MEALHSNLDEHKKKFPNLKMQLPGTCCCTFLLTTRLAVVLFLHFSATSVVASSLVAHIFSPLPSLPSGGAANMRNSRQFELTVKALGRTLSGVLFGNGTCKLSQVAIQPSIPNVKPIFTELQRLINEISSAGPDKCIEGASRFEFKEVNISLLKQQFPLPFTVKYSRVEELLALRQHYFTDVSPNRPQTGQGVRFKLTSQLSLLLNVRGTVGAQIYYGGMIQVDGSKNCSVEEHEVVCKWIRQFFMIHRQEIELQMEDEADGSKRKRMRPPKSK
jgi:hypothetical protein